MEAFTLRQGKWFCENVPLDTIARQVGTPAYIYSKNALLTRGQQLLAAFEGHPFLACYAVKANANLALLGEIFGLGLGADVVSLGELEKALRAGASPDRVVFSGVGKSKAEMERAIGAGILALQVESLEELAQLTQIAKQAKSPVRISLRVNPNIDVQTNPHIATGLYSTKFGIAEAHLEEALEKIPSAVKLVGLSCHLGSQLLELGPFEKAAERLVKLAAMAKKAGHSLDYLNLGGGLGIRYLDEEPPAINDYAKALLRAVKPSGLRLLIEPGRWLVGNAGGLLTQVLLVKSSPERNFVIVDAGMNDLMRPCLYDAYHEIVPVSPRTTKPWKCDIVGPLCETGDFLGKDRTLPQPQSDDLMLVKGCGAYGASMASTYNARPRAPEVWVEGSTFRLIRHREALESLWSEEPTPV